jgi:dienelactone hydrolase
MHVVRRRRLAALLVLLGALMATVPIARPFADGLALVIRAADMRGTLRRTADLDVEAARESELQIPHRGGSLRARVYEPAGRKRRTTLLVSGLHPSGIDEPRLLSAARQLAASGLTVVTPEIPDLMRFAVTPAITDAIEAAALWLATNDRFAPDARIGLMGISFSGGLSIVAAGRPALRNRVAYVFAYGAHDDLPRLLRYLCTGLEPGASYRAPHDYGVAVVLLGVADRLVPPEQVDPLRVAVRRFLHASALDTVDKSSAALEFAELRALAPTLPEPSATLLDEVNNRDVARLGPRLLPYVGFNSDAPALSVSRSPKPSAPVFLLHGTDDNVIPADESRYLADNLRGHAPVRLLLSTLMSHAEAEGPPNVVEVMKLASFWGDLLNR